MKRKILYVCVSLILLLSTVFTLSSCSPLYYFLEMRYQDFGPEIFGLYAEAVACVPFNNGYIPEEQAFRYNPRYTDIERIEQDEYGRILYLYRTWEAKVHGALMGGISLLICQKTDEENVWYYPDVNCISYFAYPFFRNADGEEKSFSDFPKEQIDRLKEENDWNTPINQSKCIVKNIEKGYDSVIARLSKEEGDELLNPLKAVLPDPSGLHCSYARHLTEDVYGRAMYEIEFNVDHDNRNLPFFDGHLATVALVFQPDGSCDPQTYAFFKKRNDPFYGQYNVEDDDGWSRFLKENHWNEPIS